MVNDGHVVVTRLREQGQQFHGMALGTGHPHLARHQLAHHLRAIRVCEFGRAQHILQTHGQAGVFVQTGVAQKICHRHDAHHAARTVHHRQGLDLGAAHQGPRLMQRGSKFHGQGLGRHDVLAPQFTQGALVGGGLCPAQQRHQVVRVHVQHLVGLAQGRIQIGAAEQAGVSRMHCIGNRAVLVRVGTPSQAVVDHTHAHQQQGIAQHRKDGE